MKDVHVCVRVSACACVSLSVVVCVERENGAGDSSGVGLRFQEPALAGPPRLA